MSDALWERNIPVQHVPLDTDFRYPAPTSQKADSHLATTQREQCLCTWVVHLEKDQNQRLHSYTHNPVKQLKHKKLAGIVSCTPKIQKKS